MQNLYPLFERNRILKKELLWALRDYTFLHLQLEYQEYEAGILQGCNIEVQGGELVVGPGIMKYGGFICLATEEERIAYAPSDHPQYLKMKITKDGFVHDYITYRMEAFLDTDEVLKENEFELCRFHLKQGARLRDKYISFQDMDTQYDTINLIYATWSSRGGLSMAQPVTRYFAGMILDSGNSQPEDRSFAYLCCCHPGAVPASVLNDYIRHRTGGKAERMESPDQYKKMCSIIKELNQGEIKNMEKTREKRRIIVD